MHDIHDCPDIDYYSANKILNQRDESEFQLAVGKVRACTQMQARYSESPNGIDNPTGPDQQMAISAATRALALGEEDARDSLNAVAVVVRAMSNLPGQRILIVISPGFLSLSPETMFFKSQLFDQAAASSVIINALGAGGLSAGNMDASRGANAALGQFNGQTSQDQLNSMRESENVLVEMANGTGGTFFHDNNDLESGLQNLMAPPGFPVLTGDIAQ